MCPRCSGFASGADSAPLRTLCTNTGAHDLHGGEPRPLSATGMDTAHPPLQTHGAALACVPLSAQTSRHFSFLAVGASSPTFTISLHGTWHTSECQRPVGGTSSVSPAHVPQGPKKAVFGPFFFFKGKGSYGDMESTQRWRCSLSEQVRGGSSGSVCSEHGNEDHAQRGMSTGTRGRGHTLQLVVGSRTGPSQSTLSAKPQAPTSQAGAQGSCHHNPGRASQSTGLRSPHTHSREDCVSMGGLQREPESLKGTTESSTPDRSPGWPNSACGQGAEEKSDSPIQVNKNPVLLQHPPVTCPRVEGSTEHCKGNWEFQPWSQHHHELAG